MPADHDPFLPLCKVWPCHHSAVQHSCLSSEGWRVSCPFLRFSSDHPLLTCKDEKALSDLLDENSMIASGCDSLSRKRLAFAPKLRVFSESWCPEWQRATAQLRDS